MQARDAILSLHDRAVALAGEDALDEVFPQDGVVEAALLLDRCEREVLHEDPGKDPHADLRRDALVAVHLDAFHPARRRVAFKDEAAEVFLLQLLDALACPGLHPLRVVGTGPGDHESRPLRVADEAEGVPRDAEAALHLGAHGDVFHVLSQRVGEKPVQGVPAVPADIVAQQAGADSEANLFHACHASTIRPGKKRDHRRITISRGMVFLASKDTGVLEMVPNETSTGRGGDMAKIRRVEIGEKAWKDARGWVLNPLTLAGLEGKTLGNLHVASMQPGAVRGNHAHGSAVEWLLFCGGPAALLAGTAGDSGAEEIIINGGEPELFEIPAGLPHAIVNRSDREIFLLVFYEEKDLDTRTTKIV